MAVSSVKDGVGAACGYTVSIHEQGVQEGTEYAALMGSSALGQYWVLPVRKSRIQLQREVSSPRILSLGTSLAGHNSVECRAVIYKQHSHVCISLTQVGEGGVYCQGDGVVCRSVGMVCKLKGVQGIRKGGADVGSD